MTQGCVGKMNQKLKSENYQNFGGVNSKVSPHLTGPMEFLDLKNLDFQTPGSLTHRWGSTQYVGQTFAGPINSLFEFSKLNGASYVVIAHSGGIWSGATTGNSQGLSMSLLGVTLQHWGAVNFLGIYPPQTAGSNHAYMYALGANYLGITTGLIYGQGGGLTSPGTGDTFVISPIAVQSDNKLDCAALNDFMFMADGSKFLKSDGVTTWAVGLPPVLWATNGTFSQNNNTVNGFGSVVGSSTGGIGFQYGPSFGIYYLFASYVNNRGFEGPIWPILAIRGNNQFNASLVTSFGAGTTGMLNVNLSLATPLQFGISAINIYSFYDPYNASIGQTFTNFESNDDTFYGNIRARFWNVGTPVALQVVPASGSTFTSFDAGTTFGGQTLLAANLYGPLESTIPNSYLPIGLTLGASFGFRYTQVDALNQIYPRYLEVYQNRLFLAGFSTMPSIVMFSDLSEPEGYAPDFNFEVRTNDGDYITAIRSYSTRLYIFKRKSFHALNGDSPNNFFLQEVSDQYGCLNNRCAVVFDDLLVFLDQKGVILWNGSSLEVISKKIQPTIDSINYSAALDVACMAHDKLRNQILIAVPVNGSSANNLTMVYDYMAGAWTFYDGFTPSFFAAIQGRNNTKNVFYGDTSGRVNWFGSSFLSDNGTGFTAYLKTRYLHDMGDSVQKQFRRLYVNADPVGATLSLNVNFMQDYGSSFVYSTTLFLGEFQSRIDFGISAKSLAFELSNIQTAVPLRIHGFTIESRLQRRV
jgi:hypothetical protein